MNLFVKKDKARVKTEGFKGARYKEIGKGKEDRDQRSEVGGQGSGLRIKGKGARKKERGKGIEVGGQGSGLRIKGKGARKKERGKRKEERG
jgi:hypothetical protein